MKSVITFIAVATISLSAAAQSSTMHDACAQAGAFNSDERKACEAVYKPAPAKVSLSVKPVSTCHQGGPFNRTEVEACLFVETQTNLVAACEVAGPFNAIEGQACKTVYEVSVAK